MTELLMYRNRPVSWNGVLSFQRRAPVRDSPAGVEDAMFWQYPCRTEGDAWDRHAYQGEPISSRSSHVYLGLPWATWIDKSEKCAWVQSARTESERYAWLCGGEIRALASFLALSGQSLRVHTVCQHIYWPRLLPLWRSLGVTDLWLSHCPAQSNKNWGLSLHPWPLYAVNAEDPSRREGLQIGLDPAEKTLTASFIGAHMPHYLSDIRLRLRELEGQPDCVVQVSSRWHFESVVYEGQVAGRHEVGTGSEGVFDYNRVLSQSRFSLCPAGAGANTLRFWESLACGAVPVVLGHPPVLPLSTPEGCIDWDSIVVRHHDESLTDLLARLRAMSLDEVRWRQQRGMTLYQKLKQMQCFGGWGE